MALPASLLPPAFRPVLPTAVAYSGGADSTALLLMAVHAWPGQVHAIHIHHGLQAAADDFARHCQVACAGLGVPLAVVNVDARAGQGESPEDSARQARYAALAETAMSLGARSVLLAHHADDQVETMLLALSRGAGLPGLSAMPASFERHGMRFDRPLLAASADQLREWLRDQGAQYIDDPTNADTSFTRNRIRHLLLPALAQAFPQFRETFARSARHSAQAQALLDEVASQDLAGAGAPPAVAALHALSRGRQANLLRHWLRSCHGQQASAAQLGELLDQVADCTTRGHRLHLKVGDGFVTRAGERLQFTAA